MTLRTIRRAAWLGVVALCLVVGVVAGTSILQATKPEPDLLATSTRAIAIGSEFSLVDPEGRIRTWSEFRGRPVALFFGFTNCPDICPTTLGELSVHLAGLGSRGDELSVVLISADPARDTPQALAAYLQSFDPRIVGLTGSEEAVAKTFSDFNAFRKVVPLEGGDYTVDHTAGVFLFDREGGFAGTLDLHESQEVQRAKLERLLDA